jgi:hypothetical protein
MVGSRKCPLMHTPCKKKCWPSLIIENNFILFFSKYLKGGLKLLLIYMIFFLPGFWHAQVLALTEPILCGLSLIAGCKPKKGVGK